jgi:hypothetical protein
MMKPLMASTVALSAMLLGAGSLSAAPKAEPKAEPSEQDTVRAKNIARRAGFQRLAGIVRGEPTVLEVQKSTLRYYKLEPERINGMALAARLKGLVPEVEAGIDNLVGHSYTNLRDGLYPSLPNDPNGQPNIYRERTTTSNDSLLWRVRAVWSLDRLAFNAEALDAKSLNSIEENLVREVTTLYFSRKRQLANMVLSPPEDEEELYYDKLKLDEVTATLDAMTGGMFGKRAYQGDFEVKPAPKE